jgi:hypothetical protein
LIVGGEDFVVLQAGAHGGPDAIDAARDSLPQHGVDRIGEDHTLAENLELL